MKTIFATLFAFGLGIACYAQNDSSSAESQFKRTWALSTYGGLSQFYGDLREYKFWPIPENNFDSQSERGTWHVGAALKYHISPIFGVRADAGMGTLNGTKRRIYYSYFRANYAQATVSATLDLKNLLLGTTRANRWEIEMYGGVGMIRFRSTAYQLGSGILQRRSNDNAWAFPLGLTASYALSQRFQVLQKLAIPMLLQICLMPLLPPPDPTKWTATLGERWD
ncbi:hypothetical protein [Runella sp.]|uniref:hypothetical protein n=1 Tax=Runella sp. TaxID=1960881 RepID=UPI003D13952B